MFQVCHHFIRSPQNNLGTCTNVLICGLEMARGIASGDPVLQHSMTGPLTSDNSVGNRSPFSIVICNAMKVSSKQLATYGNLTRCVWDRAAPFATHAKPVEV